MLNVWILVDFDLKFFKNENLTVANHINLSKHWQYHHQRKLEIMVL